MAADELRFFPEVHSDPWERREERRALWSRDGERIKYGWGAFYYLLDQARPPGCRAPWEGGEG